MESCCNFLSRDRVHGLSDGIFDLLPRTVEQSVCNSSTRVNIIMQLIALYLGS